MPVINSKLFNGIAPSVSDKNKRDTLATIAQNVFLQSGRIEPVKAAVNSATVTTSLRKSIYLMGSNWLQWTEEYVRVVPSPIANNNDNAFYFTGEDYPRVSWSSIAFTSPPYPAASYRLGVPAPLLAPTLTTTNGTPDDQELELDIAWVYTYVTADGREGPPSPVSTLYLAQADNLTYDIALPSTTPTGNHNFGSGALRRVYRTNTGSVSTAFQFVGEVAIGTTTFSDTLRASQLQEVLPSLDWSGPPDDNSSLFPEGPLEGLCHMGNGILAGFSGNTVWFSDPYVAHAWPVAYTKAMSFDIIAIEPSASGLYVLTNGPPSLIAGRDPASLSEIQLESRQACVSRDSVVSMDDYLIYASPDGLVGLDGLNETLLTGQTHDRASWQALDPTTIKGFYHERRYIGFYNDGSNTDGFVFDPAAGLNNFTELSNYYTVGYSDLVTDSLYVLSGTNIQAFNTGANLTAVWQSKVFELPSPSSFSCGIIDAEFGSVTLKFYADGSQLGNDIVVTSQEMFRIPAPANIYQTVQFSVTSTVEINSVILASSVALLTEV